MNSAFFLKKVKQSVLMVMCMCFPLSLHVEWNATENFLVLEILIKSLATSKGLGWHLKDHKVGTRRSAKGMAFQRWSDTTERWSDTTLATTCLTSAGGGRSNRAWEEDLNWWAGQYKRKQSFQWSSSKPFAVFKGKNQLSELCPETDRKPLLFSTYMIWSLYQALDNSLTAEFWTNRSFLNSF